MRVVAPVPENPLQANKSGTNCKKTRVELQCNDNKLDCMGLPCVKCHTQGQVTCSADYVKLNRRRGTWNKALSDF